MIYTLTLNPAIDRQLTVPSIEMDSVLRATASRADCGGKGFNVSRMVQQMGGSSVALGFAGGHAGEWLRDELQKREIATEFVWVASETRTNTSVVTPDGGAHLKVNEAGGAVSAENVASLKEVVSRLAKAGDYWVLAGSLPPGVSAEIYAELIEMLQGAGAHVVLDASGAALKAGCAASPFMVKPNAFEAEQVTGLSDPLAAAQALLASGVGNVVISQGGDGAILLNNDGTHRVSAPSIVEANPIGAGDAMVGGMVWALAEGKSLQEALQWGIASGTAAASLDGTDFGTLEQVTAFVEAISLTDLMIHFANV